MGINISKNIVVILAICCILKLNAQDSKVADSLLIKYHGQVDQTDVELLTNIVRNHSNFDTILVYSNQLIKDAINLNEKKHAAIGYYYKGMVYEKLGAYQNSLQSYYKSANLLEDISNSDSTLAATYIGIGNVYSASLNSKNAILYYNKAIKILHNSNAIRFKANAYLNAGSEYMSIGKLNKALEYYNRAKGLFEKINYELGIAYSLGNIGDIYSIKNNFTLAKLNFLDAIVIAERHNDNYALSFYYLDLARIYKKQKDLAPAFEYAQISLNTAKNAKLLPQIMRAYELLTELYAANNNLDSAYYCQSKYIEIRDSINNEEVIRKMADLRTEYEVAQKQAEVDLLSKQRQNQRIVVFGLIIVLLLSTVLVLVIYSDNKKRKILNKKIIQRKAELQKQHDQLEKLNKTKDRFFSIISHDLRGPINVLNGTTMLIRDFLDSKNYDELEELTSNMEYSVKKVQHLLDNLLEWAVSQQGEFPYKPEILDMEETCDNVLNIFIAMAATKSIDLTYEVKMNARYVYADKNSLMTIIRNLVSNALKFTHKKGSVNILAEFKEDKYCVSVSDTGVGISKEKQEDIFKLIENKSTWGTAKEKGLGIGLSLVHEFVKLNKGSISVNSTENIGTTFTFCIPQKDSPNLVKSVKDKDSVYYEKGMSKI